MQMWTTRTVFVASCEASFKMFSITNNTRYPKLIMFMFRNNYIILSVSCCCVHHNDLNDNN